MGFLKRVFGEDDDRDRYARDQDYGRVYDRHQREERSMTDEQALERYRYMLRTAPPETIERAHEEAFAQLTPEQRRMALQELASVTPESERRAYGDDPHSLARMATRAELRQPGTVINVFGGPGYGGYGMGGGFGMGGMLAGTMLGSLVAGFVGSAIANEFFDHDVTYVDADSGAQLDAQDQVDTFEGDYSGDELGAADGADFGGDDFGGDMGGGDFGGGGEF
ncbi:MAG: hypothetical protein M3281_09285 [Chloroflexota bacterium]|nr:hypothetical protein [Chloroflexota bacterium]